MRSLRIVGVRIKRLIIRLNTIRLNTLSLGAVREFSGDGKTIKKAP
jgi:hypothetical protein